MKTWIKICGVANAEDAIAAAQFGADAVGLVFHGPSLRCCSLGVAQQILAKLPPTFAVVGVWLEEPASAIMGTATKLRLTSIQTYSPETAEALVQAGYNVIPAIMPSDSAALDAEWAQLIRSCQFTRVIVDYRRCTNLTETWDPADLAPLRSRTDVVLAGGLTDDNIAIALSELVESQWLGVDEAKEVAYSWMFGNANDFFRLG